MISIYKTLNGELVRVVRCPDSMIDIQCNSGEKYIDGNYEGSKYYVSNNEAVHRPEMDIIVDKTILSADGVDSVVISNVQDGAEVFVDGVIFGIVEADGVVEISSNVPKEMNIAITLFPYFDKEIAINAT